MSCASRSPSLGSSARRGRRMPTRWMCGDGSRLSQSVRAANHPPAAGSLSTAQWLIAARSSRVGRHVQRRRWRRRRRREGVGGGGRGSWAHLDALFPGLACRLERACTQRRRGIEPLQEEVAERGHVRLEVLLAQQRAHVVAREQRVIKQRKAHVGQPSHLRRKGGRGGRPICYIWLTTIFVCMYVCAIENHPEPRGL